MPPAPHYGVNARSGKDWKPLDERAAQEHITRKEGEGDSLDAVFPLVSSGIEGQEGFKSLTGQNLMDILLMLMTSVESVPGIVGIQVCHRRISLDPRPDSSAV
jgi:hypothetical protein